MEYKEVEFTLEPRDPWCDVLVTILSNMGYDSFEETDTGCKAYIEKELFDEQKLHNIDLNSMFGQKIQVSFVSREVENINWNEEWEKNYEPVLIAEKCYIRAPFHQPKPEVPMEIIIEPKMSFGTGHHKTTSLIVEFLLETDIKNKTVLDMGCGTGVLAIVSKRLGAGKVTAIDNHLYAYENTIENAENNNVELKVLHGDSSLLGEETYDIIIANITKNILLEDMDKYEAVLNSNGLLFLSGFFEEDIDDMINKAKILGLTLEGQKEDSSWAALKMKKN